MDRQTVVGRTARALACIFAVELLTVPVAGGPLVGLAGDKYRRSYIGMIEQLGGESEQVSGAELATPSALARFTALIIVTRGDAGQKSSGLTPAASAAVAGFVAAGGRVLCAYGCGAPTEIVANNWGSAGWGSQWYTTDARHAITGGMRAGQVVRYGQYRFRMAAAEGPVRALLTEAGGTPAVTSIVHGQGEIIQTCGDLGAGRYDGTTRELATRVLLYLLYGKGQQRFGDELPDMVSRAKRVDLHTPRELAGTDAATSAAAIGSGFATAPTNGLGHGYTLTGADGTWRIHAPPGRARFAPFVYLPLGEADVEAGTTYRAGVRARLNGLDTDTLAPVNVRLRYYDGTATELALDTLSSADLGAEAEWDWLSVQTVAPAGAVRATVEVAMMLPRGSLELDELRFGPTTTAEAIFAAEAPVGVRVKAHPRAFVGPEQAAVLARALKEDDDRGVYGVSRAEMFAAVRQRADAYLAEEGIQVGDHLLPWPPEAMPSFGGGLAWNPLSGAFRDRLDALSLVYLATGDVRYGARAKQLLLALCAWPQWSDPKNKKGALEIGTISLGAVFAYDLCHGILSDEERLFAQEALRRNTLLPMYRELSVAMHDHNFYSLWTAAMGMCALATLGEAEGASTCLRLAEDGLLFYLDARASRHRPESQGYDSWAYGLLINLAEALKRNTGVDHLDHPFLPVIPRFAVAFMANDRKRHAWFSDAGGTVDYVPWHYPLTLLCAWTGDELAGWYLRETRTVGMRSRDVYKLLAYRPGMPAADAAPQSTGAVFPRAGWASLRSDWSVDGTFIALQCSSSGQGHQHLDQGNFLIHRGEQNLAMDCGYASALGATLREFARGSVGHNCVLVDGKGQTRKRGSIPFFRTTARVGYAMADASAAYSPSLAERVHRHFVYIKPDILLVVDDLRAAGGPRAFSWLLHPHSWASEGLATVTLNGEPMVVNGPGGQGHIEVTKGSESMRVRALHDGVTARYVTYPGAEKYNPYVEIKSRPSRDLVLPVLMTFGDTRVNNQDLSVRERRVHLRGHADVGECRVVLMLAGEHGESPQLQVSVNGERLVDLPDLSVAGRGAEAEF